MNSPETPGNATGKSIEDEWIDVYYYYDLDYEVAYTTVVR